MAALRHGQAVSPDANIHYLPAMYLLSEDAIAMYPTLRGLPRKAREIIYDDRMMGIIDSDQFLHEVTEGLALLVFPHLGMRGRYADYTAYNPLYYVINFSQLWASSLREASGWDINALLKYPSHTEIPFFGRESVSEMMSKAVKAGMEHASLEPVLAAMREYPCHEDFVTRRSNPKIDFWRKWYHTRAKTKTISYEQHAGGGGKSTSVPLEDPYRMEEYVEASIFVEGFKSSLSVTDRAIVEMREDDYTFAEIAAALGYKTHSAVVKKMKAIKEAYLEYSKIR